ncbi:hypothetical protein [Streptomyces sp. NPDC047976]|uniref:hypothetical protein n=1 Tax=Streptomyces sp. NPDC047976 TaxID=3155746 RepID=UPI00343569A4
MVDVQHTTSPTVPGPDLSGRRLVVIDADVPTARTAHTLGCHTVFVQQPGSPVPDLVDDQSGYYSVDFTGELFPGFVTDVLAPLAPTAVVSLSAAGLGAAALAGALLGTPGLRPEVLAGLAGVSPAATGPAGREVILHAFSTDGDHRLLAVTPLPTASAAQAGPPLTPHEQAAAAAALGSHLDGAGLLNGPSRTRARVSGDAVHVIATRPHPGSPDEAALVRRATGIDLTRWALGWPLGLREAHCTVSDRILETSA